MTNQFDPFDSFRESSSAYDSVTDADGRTLSLHAIDLAAFHSVAHQVLRLANASDWRVLSIQRLHPCGTVLTLMVAPRLPKASSHSAENLRLAIEGNGLVPTLTSN